MRAPWEHPAPTSWYTLHTHACMHIASYNFPLCAAHPYTPKHTRAPLYLFVHNTPKSTPSNTPKHTPFLFFLLLYSSLSYFLVYPLYFKFTHTHTSPHLELPREVLLLIIECLFPQLHPLASTPLYFTPFTILYFTPQNHPLTSWYNLLLLNSVLE